MERTHRAAFSRVDEFTRQISWCRRSKSRRQTHYRLYCDNDDILGRWEPRPDPNEPLPDDYVREIFRSGANGEWTDDTNGVLTMGMPKCRDPNTQAATYTINSLLGDYREHGQPHPRTVITFCDSYLVRWGYFGSLEYFKSEGSLGNYINGIQNARVGSGPLDAFRRMTAMVVLHEFGHAWPFVLPDQRSPTVEGQSAAGWRDVQMLDDVQSINNADNYAYYCLIAGLADRGWRVELGSAEEVSGGLLVQDPSIMRHRS
ncbi:MAG: hypothetical protein Q9227_001680 [Pyrenula ochraceoflavens]